MYESLDVASCLEHGTFSFSVHHVNYLRTAAVLTFVWTSYSSLLDLTFHIIGLTTQHSISLCFHKSLTDTPSTQSGRFKSGVSKVD